jgi:hypothetical protein
MVLPCTCCCRGDGKWIFSLWASMRSTLIQHHPKEVFSLCALCYRFLRKSAFATAKCYATGRPHPTPDATCAHHQFVLLLSNILSETCHDALFTFCIIPRLLNSEFEGRPYVLPPARLRSASILSPHVELELWCSLVTTSCNANMSTHSCYSA